MGVLALVVIAASVVALTASYGMTRAARFSPLVNSLIGALVVVLGFVLLALIAILFTR
jgi:hypothetical protein